MQTPWPSYPYVPGQTPRHAEDAFDSMKGVTSPLSQSVAWHAGLRFFDAGYYWEAHEVWEAVWMGAPANSPEKCLLQGMIQLANAGLKRRMGRMRAAERLDRLADGLLSEARRRGGPDVMGLSPADLEAARSAVKSAR